MLKTEPSLSKSRFDTAKNEAWVIRSILMSGRDDQHPGLGASGEVPAAELDQLVVSSQGAAAVIQAASRD